MILRNRIGAQRAGINCHCRVTQLLHVTRGGTVNGGSQRLHLPPLTVATASMAFPIPSHLPRKQDVSSRILSKIDSATYQSLNPTITSSWLNELDETIQATKVLFYCASIHSIT